MSGLIELVSQHLDRQQIEQIAGRLGATPEATESAIGMALPTLLGAVARKADDDDATAQLHRELEQHEGSSWEQWKERLHSQDNAPAGVQAFGGLGDVGGLLTNMLGGRQSRVEQGIGKASGMSGSQVAALLAMLAPLVMGAIAKKSRAENMDAGGLGGMLRGERKQMENQASGGLLAGLLDQDGDGDFDFQDVMKLGMKRLFGK
jgi:hypothetical protein